MKISSRWQYNYFKYYISEELFLYLDNFVALPILRIQKHFWISDTIDVAGTIKIYFRKHLKNHLIK